MPTKFARTRAPRYITELVSFRLHQLANMSALGASLRYERKFNISLLEWRSIAMLGGFAPLSLKELARRAGLDKSYASRTVAGLIKRGWIISERNDNDGRGVMLSLSPSGQDLYERIFPDAAARNERFLSILSADQRKQLMELLSLLHTSGLKLLDQEKRATAGEIPLDDDAVEPSRKAKKEMNQREEATSVDIEQLRHLVIQMADLLDSHGP